MDKQDIGSREDIKLLVDTFYGKVRGHDELGPFFNDTILDWPAHMKTLTDFWEMTLFGTRDYKGNPMRTHIEVDRSFNGSVEQEHFGMWLQMWFETLDELFSGEKMTLAKERARNIAHIMFIKIFSARRK